MAAGVLFYRGVFGIIICSLNIVGNVMTIFAFFQIKLLSANPSNLLILALSFADLFYGIVVLILDAIPYAFLDDYIYGEYGCMLLVSFSNFFVVGNLILVAISIDRLLLVTVNYSTYVKIQTKSRIRLAIAVCLSIGAVSALLDLSLWNYAKRTNPVAAKFNFSKNCFSPARFTKWFGLFYSLGLFCIPVFLVGILSGIFFCLLIMRIRKTNAVRSMASFNNVTLSQRSNQNPTERVDNSTSEAKVRYTKAAVTLGVLVLAMGISILPYCFYILIGIFCPDCTNTTALYVVLTILQLNPLLDPFFYSATQRNIRDFYKNKLAKLHGRIRDFLP